VIGATIDVSTYELMRWARRMVRELRLKPREALVLYVLVSYADRQGRAWPAFRTIVEDAGYTAKWRESVDRRGRKRGGWRCSTVSAALDRLRELQLIWTTYHGTGRAAVHELLYTVVPSNTADGTDPSEMADGKLVPPQVADGNPSAIEVPEEPERQEPRLQEPQIQEPEDPSAYVDGSHHSEQDGNDDDEAARVRATIRRSLRAGAAA